MDEKITELLKQVERRERAAKDAVKGMAYLILIPLAIADGVCITLYRGWLLAKAFAWFIIPVFHVAPIGVAQAVGLLCVGEIYRGYKKTKAAEDPSPKALVSAFIESWVHAFFLYGIAAVIHHYTR